jgi:hypothetical protein
MFNDKSKTGKTDISQITADKKSSENLLQKEKAKINKI